MRETRVIFCAILAVFTAWGRAAGQVTLEARPAQSRVLPFAPIPVSVRIGNNTSHEIVLGGSNPSGTLSFDIEQTPGVTISAKPEAQAAALVVPPHKEIVKEFDLNGLYAFRRTGPYSVSARMEWKGLSFVSPRSYFDVVPGFEIGKLVAEVGPSSALLTLSLLTLNRDRGEYLFLRVEDPARNLCHASTDLGRVVRVYAPTLKVDGRGDIHVLHQSGPTLFTHNVLTFEGVLVSRSLYMARVGTPVLRDGDDGQIVVEGGEPAEVREGGAGVEAPRDDQGLFSPVRSRRSAD